MVHHTYANESCIVVRDGATSPVDLLQVVAAGEWLTVSTSTQTVYCKHTATTSRLEREVHNDVGPE